MNSRKMGDLPAKGFSDGMNEINGNAPFGISLGGHQSSSGTGPSHPPSNNTHAPWQEFAEVFGFEQYTSNGRGRQNDKTTEQQKSGHEERVVRAGFGCSNEDIARLPPSRNRGRSRRSGTAKRNDSGIHQKQNGHNKDENKAAADAAAKPVFPVGLHQNVVKDDVMPIESAMSATGRVQHRTWLHCSNCGRVGHGTDECYRGPDGLIKNSPNKRNMRCYNCQGTGHMAARCPKPRIHYSPRKLRAAEALNKEVGGNRNDTQMTASSTPAADRGFSMDPEALEIMCRLMQDPSMRRHATRIAPELYEKAVTYMLSRVKI